MRGFGRAGPVMLLLMLCVLAVTAGAAPVELTPASIRIEVPQAAPPALTVAQVEVSPVVLDVAFEVAGGMAERHDPAAGDTVQVGAAVAHDVAGPMVEPAHAAAWRQTPRLAPERRVERWCRDVVLVTGRASVGLGAG